MSDILFGERKSNFEHDLKRLLTIYKIRIVTFLETEEVNGEVLNIKPIINFIDDSKAYEKKVDIKN